MVSKRTVEPWFYLPKTHSPSKRATVIGSGLSGSAVAYHLAKNGWQVEVLDKQNTIASETSGLLAGIFKLNVNSRIDKIIEYNYSSYHYFIEYFNNLLNNNFPINHSFCSVQTLHPKSGLTHEKKLSGWVNAKSFCTAQLLASESINVKTSTVVSDFKKEEGLWVCRDDKGSTVSKSHILILANGWNLSQCPGGQFLFLDPLAGQLTILKARELKQKSKHVLMDKKYLIPYSEQHYICGASYRQSESVEISDEDHLSNIQGVEKLLPDLKLSLSNVAFGQTAVRTVSKDHLPVMGAVPDWEFYIEKYNDLHHGRSNQIFPSAEYQKGLYMIGALGSHGISNSPYLGKLLCDLIENTHENNHQQAYNLLHPARFLIRQLKKKPVDRNF